MELPSWEAYKELPWPIFMFVIVHVVRVLLLVLPARAILAVRWRPHPPATTALNS